MKSLIFLIGVCLCVITGHAAEPKLELNEHLAPLKPWLGKWERKWKEDSNEGYQSVIMTPVAGGNAVTVEEVTVNNGTKLTHTFSVYGWDATKGAIVNHGFAADGSVGHSITYITGKEAITHESSFNQGKQSTTITKVVALDANTFSFEVLSSFRAGKPVPAEELWKFKFTRVKE